MKKLSMLLLLVLTACTQAPNNQSETAANTQNTKEAVPNNSNQSTSDNKSINEKNVTFSTYVYQYDLPKEMKEICRFDNQKVDDETGEMSGFCTEIDIKLAKIEPKWIEQAVNKAITDDDGAQLLKFKQSVDDFVAEHLELINDAKQMAEEEGQEFEYAPSFFWQVEPEMLSSHNNLTQIVINSDIYMGGAHDVPNSEYLIFDMDLQSQIKLGDTIEKGKEGELYEMSHNAFKDYLRTELEIKTDQEIKEYEDMYEFQLSENFYFDDKGLVLVYQPYEMGSFAQGFIELVIPFSELSQAQVLKAQYLPK